MGVELLQAYLKILAKVQFTEINRAVHSSQNMRSLPTRSRGHTHAVKQHICIAWEVFGMHFPGD